MMLALLAFMSFPAAYADDVNQTISYSTSRCGEPGNSEGGSLSDFGGANKCLDFTGFAKATGRILSLSFADIVNPDGSSMTVYGTSNCTGNSLTGNGNIAKPDSCVNVPTPDADITSPSIFAVSIFCNVHS